MVSSVHYNNAIELQPLLPEQPSIIPEETSEFDDTLNDLSNVLVTYCLDQGDERTGKPVYCPELGLAIEKLSEGYTIQNLWQVLPPQTSTTE